MAKLRLEQNNKTQPKAKLDLFKDRNKFLQCELVVLVVL
jgi:hypothetical protein